MTSSHPHWQRSALIAAVGLFIALLSALWIGVTIRSVGPQTISLAYRIDAKNTLFFIRTTDIGKLKENVRRVNGFFLEDGSLPDIPELPEGVSYEYALMTGSGSHEWMIDIHLKNQEQSILRSDTSSDPLLSTKRINESLGAKEHLFRKEAKGSPESIFVNLDAASVFTSPKSDVLQAMLSPFSHALVLEEKNGDTVLILERKEPASSFSATPASGMPETGTAPLFALSMSHPMRTLEPFESVMRRENPALLEGMRGILRKKLETLTSRSDIGSSADDLMRNGLSMVLIKTEKGPRFVLTAKAKDTRAVNAWLESIQSVATPAMIRTQTFPLGNSRTDVIAAPVQNEPKTKNGWTLITVGLGSALPRTIATKGTTIIVSDDDSLLGAAMNKVDNPIRDLETLKGGIQGSVDISWLLSTLNSDPAELRAVVGKDTKSIRWDATEEADWIKVRYWMK